MSTSRRSQSCLRLVQESFQFRQHFGYCELSRIHLNGAAYPVGNAYCTLLGFEEPHHVPLLIEQALKNEGGKPLDGRCDCLQRELEIVSKVLDGPNHE